MNANQVKIGAAVVVSFAALAGGVMAAKQLGQWLKPSTPEPVAASQPATTAHPEKKAGEEPQDAPPPPLYPPSDLDSVPGKRAAAPARSDADTLQPPPGWTLDAPAKKPARPATTKSYDPALDDEFAPSGTPKLRRTGFEEPVPGLTLPGKPNDDGAPKLGPPSFGDPKDNDKKPGKLIDLPLDPPGSDPKSKPVPGAPPPPIDDVPPLLPGVRRVSNPPTDPVPGLSLPGSEKEKKDDKAKTDDGVPGLVLPGNEKEKEKKDVKKPVDDKKGPPPIEDLPPPSGPTLPPPRGETGKKEADLVPLPGANKDGKEKDPKLTNPALPADGPTLAPPGNTKTGTGSDAPKIGDTSKPNDKLLADPPVIKPMIKPGDAPPVVGGPKPPPVEPLPATPRGPKPPVTDQPAATIGARPDPVVEAEPPIVSYDEEWYYCKPGDTLEGISQKFFFTPKYEQALRKYNLDRNYKTIFRQEKPSLGQGDVVKVPPARILERNYPDTIPGFKGGATPASRPTGPAAANTPAGREDLGQPREYVVPRDGMTLRDVAREQLRDEKQWTRIFMLNREWNPSAPIPRDTRIFLPSGQ